MEEVRFCTLSERLDGQDTKLMKRVLSGASSIVDRRRFLNAPRELAMQIGNDDSLRVTRWLFN